MIPHLRDRALRRRSRKLWSATRRCSRRGETPRRPAEAAEGSRRGPSGVRARHGAPAAAEAVAEEGLRRRARSAPPRRQRSRSCGRSVDVHLRSAAAKTRVHLRSSLAAAAAIMVLGGVMVPALHSLPGDSLYALKTGSESVRVFFASGRVKLASGSRSRTSGSARSRNSSLAVVCVRRGSARKRHQAIENIDPMLATLIKSTLQEATQEVTRAAAILISQPQDDATGLDQLVAVSRRGQNSRRTSPPSSRIRTRRRCCTRSSRSRRSKRRRTPRG